MDDSPQSDLERSYDRVADQYVAHLFDELRHKPLDRQLLDRLADSVRGPGPACDMGCGPGGEIARYLHERGIDVCGVDVSAGMLECARRLNPQIEFQQGNMLSLEIPDSTWAGIAAFYSIIHIARPEVLRALTELRRALRPGGILLLTFHIGDDTLHVEELWGEQVSLDFQYFQPDEMARYLRTAGFDIEEIVERDPYPDVEYQSRRVYIFAKKI